MADACTLFLDEIGELPLSIQAKLLRVIQEGEIQRLGWEEMIRVDAARDLGMHRSNLHNLATRLI